MYYHLSRKQELGTPPPCGFGIVGEAREENWSERKSSHCLDMHSLNGCLLNTYYVPGTELGPEGVVEKRTCPHIAQAGVLKLELHQHHLGCSLKQKVPRPSGFSKSMRSQDCAFRQGSLPPFPSDVRASGLGTTILKALVVCFGF